MMLLRALFVLYSSLTNGAAFLMPVTKISLLRRGIDTIDDKISCLIEARMEISKKIGALKKKEEIDEPLREDRILTRIKDRHPRLPPELVDDVWNILFTFSKRVQRNG